MGIVYIVSNYYNKGTGGIFFVLCYFTVMMVENNRLRKIMT